VILFLFFGAWLRDLKRTSSARLPAAILAGILLAVNLVFGLEQFGAKNWIEIGGFTIQPSEFVKIAYIYAGAATLDRLYRGRNLLLFIVFSAACVGALALMGDFGTALVFFATFLVISFLRSGNFATIILAVTGAGLAGFLAISVKPYIADRFATWGTAWEDLNGKGFQQTRAMSAVATGGLFGNGAGKGWLSGIVASETDLAFEVAAEELGLIVAFCAVAALIVMAVFVVKNAVQARSSFYVIAGVGVISMMMIQMALNVFGSLDLLPFTGVTFPFVSMGGSSLISCWVMLAFIKAMDTRKNSSFVVKSPTGIHDRNEFTMFEESKAFEPEEEPFVEDASESAVRHGRNLFDRRGERRGRKK
jgi:cell division protein FtsW (lipid II flippase)